MKKFYSTRAARFAFVSGRAVFFFNGSAFDGIGYQRSRRGGSARKFTKFLRFEKPKWFTIE